MRREEVIRERHKLIRQYLKDGLSYADITRKLVKVQEGKYKASYGTVIRDIGIIRKEREKWDNTCGAYHKDERLRKRENAIQRLLNMIQAATNKGATKTAGDLIEKYIKLEGLDKIEVEKVEKDEFVEKYKHRTPEEITKLLIEDFKDFAATMIRNAQKKMLDNIIDIRLYFIIEEDGKRKKMRINRYGKTVEITT